MHLVGFSIKKDVSTFVLKCVDILTNFVKDNSGVVNKMPIGLAQLMPTHSRVCHL